MTRPQIAVWVAVAVTVFWGVGAYNRLVSLRNRIAQAFAAVDTQLQARQATLLRWLQAAPRPVGLAESAGSAEPDPAVPPAVAVPAAIAAADGISVPDHRIDTATPPPAAETLHAAGQQLQSACDALRSRPGAARRAVSLRLAERTLAEARARFGASVAAAGRAAADAAQPADAEAAARFSALTDELAAADNTLGFACRQFNDTTAAYNDALRQLPTRLVGWLFGFREAGTL